MISKDDQPEKKKKSILLGMGFDNEDDHKRITEGENFLLAGGSQKTHDIMTQKVLEFNSLMNKKYGKKLEDLTRQEYYAIVRTIDGDQIHWQYWNDLYGNFLKNLSNNKKKRF